MLAERVEELAQGRLHGVERLASRGRAHLEQCSMEVTALVFRTQRVDTRRVAALVAARASARRRSEGGPHILA
ncbi:MAG: hypothetical protein JNK45_25105 [Myxococcales bacterium]|nr:hypothetical protein [Myxococcales bacterium]